MSGNLFFSRQTDLVFASSLNTNVWYLVLSHLIITQCLHYECPLNSDRVNINQPHQNYAIHGYSVDLITLTKRF